MAEKIHGFTWGYFTPEISVELFHPTYTYIYIYCWFRVHMFCSVKVGHFSDQVYHYYIGGPKNHGLLPCDIGGAKEPGMMYFPTK